MPQQSSANGGNHHRHSPSAEVPMVGRFAESDQFSRLLGRILDGRQGQVLVLEGEAGIGKSRFLQFCREAAAAPPGTRDAGARVIAGSYRHRAGGAYAGLRAALVELFGGEKLKEDAIDAAAQIAASLPALGYAASAAEAADVAAFLTRFLRPSPGAAGEPVGVPSPQSGQALHQYVIARLERFLRRASLQTPLVLLLEDLHWADAESLAFLQHLTAVMATDPARLLIVATLRSEEREASPALVAALQQMGAFEGTCHRLVLSRLGEGETASLIEEVLQAGLEDRSALHSLAAGNPLHVLSILRYLASEELLERAGSGWRVKRGVRLHEILPPTVRQVVGLRLRRLAARDPEGPARQELLAWAAVAGRRFDAEVLAEALEVGAPHLSARLDAHLDALIQADLLHECPRLPGDVLEFDHDLLREVVLAEQEDASMQQTRHGSLAAAKRRRAAPREAGGRGDRSLLPEVADHYLEAGQWLEAVRSHKEAGDAARDSLAFRDAAGFYGTAARLLTERPDLPLNADERAGLYEAQAVALETLGEMDGALAAYQAAQAHTQDDPIRWARSERSIAWLLSWLGQLQEAATAGERAREVMERAGTRADLADSLRTLAQVEMLRGRYEAALAYLQRALPLYQQLAPSVGLARCYAALTWVHSQQGNREALLAATQQQLAVSEALGDPIEVAKALNNRADALRSTGQAEEVLPLLVRAAEICERHHVDYVLPVVYHSLAETLLNCDRAVEARPYLERGLKGARRSGEARMIADFHRLLARQAASGRPAQARAHFDEALRVCAGTDLEPQKAQICLEYGQFLLSAGEPQAAVHRFEEALAIRRRLGTDGVAEAEAAVRQAREATS